MKFILFFLFIIILLISLLYKINKNRRSNYSSVFNDIVRDESIKSCDYNIQVADNYIEFSLPFLAGLFKGKLVYLNNDEIMVDSLDPNESYFLYKQLMDSSYELKYLLENCYYYDFINTRPFFTSIKNKLGVSFAAVLEMSPKEFIERSKAYKIAKEKYQKSKDLSLQNISKGDVTKNKHEINTKLSKSTSNIINVLKVFKENMKYENLNVTGIEKFKIKIKMTKKVFENAAKLSNVQEGTIRKQCTNELDLDTDKFFDITLDYFTGKNSELERIMLESCKKNDNPDEVIKQIIIIKEM